MAALSRPQPQRHRRSRRRRIVDSIRATLGRGHATVKRMRPINRIRRQATRQTGKGTPGRLRSLRDRGVAGTRHLLDQSLMTIRGRPARAGRRLGRLARRGGDLASATGPIPSARERGLGAAERTAPAVPHQDEPAKARGRTHRRERQAKPRRAKRRKKLEQQTIRELRERARQAGIKTSHAVFMSSGGGGGAV
jgi:hypothetical protein